MSFDVGGTLIQPWPSVGHIYAQAAAHHHRIGIEPEVLNRQFLQAWNHRDSFDYSRPAWRRLVEETFQGLLEFPFGEQAFDWVYDHFACAQAWRIHPDVVEVLDALRRAGFKLAIISNWDQRLRPLLEALGLASRFEIITVSHAAGCLKPAAEIFLRTAHSLGVSPRELLHVGDSYREDQLGALEAGCQAAWLRRGLGAAFWPQISSLRGLLGGPQFPA